MVVTVDKVAQHTYNHMAFGGLWGHTGALAGFLMGRERGHIHQVYLSCLSGGPSQVWSVKMD